MTVSVLVADDHAPIRREIIQTLEESGRFTVSAEARDSPTAVQAALTTQPQLCLLDIRMPGNGLAAAWEITARLPQTKVVMLTVSRNDNDLFAALRAGASGYLLKDVDINHLLDALDEVMADEPAISHELISRLVAEFRDRSARRRSVLRPPPARRPTHQPRMGSPRPAPKRPNHRRHRAHPHPLTSHRPQPHRRHPPQTSSTRQSRRHPATRVTARHPDIAAALTSSISPTARCRLLRSGWTSSMFEMIRPAPALELTRFR